MLATTRDIVRSALNGDPTLSPTERSRLLRRLSEPNESIPSPVQLGNGPRILRRREAAERLGLSVRSVDKLCKEGSLAKYRLPGRVRACGILESDLLAMIKRCRPPAANSRQ
jgi:hypothetical protein